MCGALYDLLAAWLVGKGVVSTPTLRSMPNSVPSSTNPSSHPKPVHCRLRRLGATFDIAQLTLLPWDG